MGRSIDAAGLSGRRALVTGGNSGIGLAVATGLARRGSAVTLACRNLDAAANAAEAIRNVVPGAVVDVAELDLASLHSVRACAEKWDGPLDLLVNNAGLMAPPRWQPTVDGYEMQFGTNHLGHFALTGRLLYALLAAESARVVTVSSLAHRSGTAGVLLGNPERGYRPMLAYSNSKLANLLFGLQLHRLASLHQVSVSSTVAHPGVSATNLFRSSSGIGASALFRTAATALSRIVLQSPAAGANPVLLAATEAAPGSYTGPQWFGEFRGPPGPARLSPIATDLSLAEQLWDLSEQLTDVSYDWTGAS